MLTLADIDKLLPICCQFVYMLPLLDITLSNNIVTTCSVSVVFVFVNNILSTFYSCSCVQRRRGEDIMNTQENFKFENCELTEHVIYNKNFTNLHKHIIVWFSRYSKEVIAPKAKLHMTYMWLTNFSSTKFKFKKGFVVYLGCTCRWFSNILSIKVFFCKCAIIAQSGLSWFIVTMNWVFKSAIPSISSVGFICNWN